MQKGLATALFFDTLVHAFIFHAITRKNLKSPKTL
jgi:hypothetical protein